MADVVPTQHPLGMTEAQRQAALEANKSAREAREKQAKEAEARVKAEAEEREKIALETMARQDKSKPTPTPEELSLAAAGQHVDEKEWDGSPPQGITPEDATAAAKSYKQSEDTAWVGAKQIDAKHLEAGKSGQYKTRQAKPA